MRGNNDTPQSFWYSIDREEPIEANHPLRAIKRMVDETLRGMDKDLRKAYSDRGRRSVAPSCRVRSRLLKALLLQAPCSIRSERERCRRLETDLLVRWFRDLSPDETVVVPTVFTRHRERLAEHGLTSRFFGRVVKQARSAGSVRGPCERRALHRRRVAHPESCLDQEPEADRPRGRRRCRWRRRPSLARRRSAAQPQRERRLPRRASRKRDAPQLHGPAGEALRKGGTGAYLFHSMHVMTENRHGLVVAVAVGEANGTSARECALKMVRHIRRRHRMRVATLGADAGYDVEEFLQALERAEVTPQVALRKPGFGRGVEGGEARAAMRQRQRRVGYWKSQRRRKVVEEFFGWAKTVSVLRRSRHVGHWKITQQLEITALAFNLVRMRRLLAA